MKNLLKITLTLLLAIIIVLGFALPVNPPQGTWQLQQFPNLNGRSISDIIFVDSLIGYAVTRLNSSSDTNYILKSTNSGNNWSIVYKQLTSSIRPFNKVQFLNKDTGFVGGNRLLKTTNGGTNWVNMTLPSGTNTIGLHALNEDTIWFTDDIQFDGGIYRTTDKGASWLRQYDASPGFNPYKIYMYNGRIGFMTRSSNLIYKTTNSGFNWFTIPGNGTWLDIYFIDSLTGWKANGDGVMMKTTDGGVSWNIQVLPFGGIIFSTGISGFSVLNKDTLWGSGGMVSNGGIHRRGIIYRTTNGGTNWLFQVPDTSFGIGFYPDIQFLNKNTGWCYGVKANSSTINLNIYTTNGGDTTFLTGLQQVSNEVPKEFLLYQNYPNPFNPKTNFEFRIASLGLVTLKIFDITGQEIAVLINEELRTGEYQTDWNASGLSSGAYFYQLTVTTGKEVYRETKKMILIK